MPSTRSAAGLRAGILSISLVLILAAGAGARAQGPAAASGPAAGAVSSIAGVVTDPDGARVRAALIVLANASGVAATTRADKDGSFIIDAVPPGQYELRVSADGLRADPVEVTVVAGGPTVRVPVTMHLSAVVESVVVSAAQVEVPTARAADSVTVLSGADLQARQVETVADAMRSVPGLTVARNGGRGAVTSVFPRGGESDYTLVMVDGIKANAFGGGYDFSTLGSADVERVEVVRGPESALFGADAMGGVVQVITRHGGSPRVDGLVEGGSFGTSHVAAGTSGSRGAWNWGATAERYASDGYTGIAPATGERVSNDDWLSRHASFSGGWHGAGGADVRGVVNLTSGDRGFPGPYGSNPIGAYTQVDTYSRGKTTTRQYGARWLQPLSSGARHVRLTVGANYLDQRSDFTSKEFLSESGTTRFDVRAQADVDLSRAAALSFGGEFQSEAATASYITAAAQAPVPIDRRVTGGFGELRYQPASSVTLTAGLRVDRFVRDALAGSPDPYTPRPPFGAETDTAVNPRLSAAWFLGGGGTGAAVGWTRLHASAGTGMRAPDAIEIAFTDNPNLKPERSRSVEAGIDQSLGGERVVVGATAFFNRYEDLIVAVGPALEDASRYRTDNIANASAKGVELSTSLRPARGLDVRLGYTFLDAAVLAVDRAGQAAPPPFNVGDPLLRRPRHAGSLDVVYTRGALSAFGRLGARTRVLDVEPSYGTYGGLFYNPGYSVVDLGASWRLGYGVTVLGRVGNLLDRRYEETYGFPALGRNAMIGVRVAAGR